MTTSFEINSSELVDKNLSSENFRGIVSNAFNVISQQCVVFVAGVVFDCFGLGMAGEYP